MGRERELLGARPDVERTIRWLSKLTGMLTWYEMEGPVKSKEEKNADDQKLREWTESYRSLWHLLRHGMVPAFCIEPPASYSAAFSSCARHQNTRMRLATSPNGQKDQGYSWWLKEFGTTNLIHPGAVFTKNMLGNASKCLLPRSKRFSVTVTEGPQALLWPGTREIIALLKDSGAERHANGLKMLEK